MRTARLIALVVALLCLVSPARAAGQLGLSWDGRAWASQLTGALFDRPGTIDRWVPGDSDTRHFYVRNQGGDAARLTIAYDLPPDTLVNADDFEVTAAVDGGAPVVITPGVGWLPLDQTTLADGAVADVAVTATFRLTSTNRSMSQAFPLAFRVTLTEVVGATPLPDATPTPAGVAHPHGSPAPGSGPAQGSGPAEGSGPAQSSGGGGLLPGTGAPEVGWFVALGILCLSGGLLIVGLSRRRERDAD